MTPPASPHCRTTRSTRPGWLTLDELKTARHTPGIAIRRAPGTRWYHFTFNGAPGSILADKALRLAIAKGIDRQAIAEISQRGLADNPVPLNNHIFVAGQEGYQDNSGVVAFDPEKAKQELDALGWRMNGQFREKDGRQLVIRDVLYDSQTTRQFGQIAQNNLAQIGVKLDLDVRPAAASSPTTSTSATSTSPSSPGAATHSRCLPDPDLHRPARRATSARSAARRSTRRSNRRSGELDPAKARVLANELDKLIWDEVFSLPLFQSAGNVAVRSNLANFGAFGIADADYTKIGFMKP